MPRACNIPPHLLAFCGSAQPQSGPAVPTPVARGDKAGRPWTSTKWRKRRVDTRTDLSDPLLHLRMLGARTDDPPSSKWAIVSF